MSDLPSPLPAALVLLAARGLVSNAENLRVLANEFIERAYAAEANLRRMDAVANHAMLEVTACRSALLDADICIASLHSGIMQHHATATCDSHALKGTADRALPILNKVRSALAALGV